MPESPPGWAPGRGLGLAPRHAPRPAQRHAPRAAQPEGARRPTLLNGCGPAATAAEARFRIGYPFLPRDSRIVAVDTGAAAVICRASGRHWSGAAHFLRFDAPVPGGHNGSEPDATLRTCGGADVLLSEELNGADITVIVATSGQEHGGPSGASGRFGPNGQRSPNGQRGKGAQAEQAASLIGQACAARGITTVGVAYSETEGCLSDAAAVLRRSATVLVSCTGEEDLFELLTALRT